MLKDCLELFNNIPDEKRSRQLIDNYIPEDGKYVLVEEDGDSYRIKDYVDIQMNKKTREVSGRTNLNYSYIKYCDYNSKLLEMNKPVDSKKIIQSNNYLSFFIKKENLTSGKLTEDIINNYYETLKNPASKYKKNAKSMELYKKVESEIGPVDCERVERIRKWIVENIFNLGIEIEGKGYLKIFFCYPKDEYDKEGRRYLIPNIYNKNDMNVKIKGMIYGLPNNNMCLNQHKPYLENKSRKVKIPLIMNGSDVLVQKEFFDYLISMAASGRPNIYLSYSDGKITSLKNGEMPENDFNGIFLRLVKGKNEAEIVSYDVITGYKPKLKKAFLYKNVLNADLPALSKESELPSYGEVEKKNDLQAILNSVLYSKYLTTNYFTEPKDISLKDSILKRNLLVSRDAVYNWLYKDNTSAILSLLDRVSMNIVKNSMDNGYLIKATHQFNLRWSLKEYFGKGEIIMADKIKKIKDDLRVKLRAENTDVILCDDEYYFALGQLVYYFINKSKSKKKPMSLANPFINARNGAVIKEKLRNLYKKYNYDIESSDRRIRNLYAMVGGYEAETPVDQDMIIAGFLNSSLIYEKEK